jgi:hypothetical protein
VDHIIVLGDAHLRRILRSYAHYYKKSERIGRLIEMHRYLARFSGPEANSDTHCFAHSITTPSSFRFSLHSSGDRRPQVASGFQKIQKIAIVHTNSGVIWRIPQGFRDAHTWYCTA